MRASTCHWCQARLPDLEQGFCPVCGKPSRASAERASEMVYKDIKVNENGKALVCPHCENEELTPGDYCKICGNNIINRCTDMPNPKAQGLVIRGCHTVLQGNARYCSKCGNESTFYQKGWLKDWRMENTRKAIRNAKLPDNTIPFKDIREEKIK